VAHRRRRRFEHAVTGGMAVPVADRFEVVEIKVKEAGARLWANERISSRSKPHGGSVRVSGSKSIRAPSSAAGARDYKFCGQGLGAGLVPSLSEYPTAERRGSSRAD
jgi:hypothetical protein